MLVATLSAVRTSVAWATARSEAYSLGAALGAVGAQHEVIALASAGGRTLAEDLHARVSLPGVDTAAMDGWVVRGDGPWRIGARILAGAGVPIEELAPGRARPIATGAPVPRGATAVVRSEAGSVRHDGMLQATEPVRCGQDIRRAGEEIGKGERLARSGARLTPARLALAAAAGHDEVTARSAPAVTIVVLGDEVCHGGVPAPGLVRDVFGIALPAMLGGSAVGRPAVVSCGDTLDETVRALDSSLRVGGLVVTTGGSAHGPVDHARAALDVLGARAVFDGVDMRPGHPVMLHEATGSAVLSLPGNPLAGLVSFLTFAPAILAGLSGRPVPALRRLAVADALENPRRSTRLVPCRWDDDGLRPVGWTGSGMLRGLADADVVAVVPGGGLRHGQTCEVLPMGDA